MKRVENDYMTDSRPGHSLKDLKKPVTRKNSLIERLSRTGSARDVTEPPRRYHLTLIIKT